MRACVYLAEQNGDLPAVQVLDSTSERDFCFREEGESAAEVWRRMLEVEKKCDFENITKAELPASKFLSLIGRSSGDYELKRNIKMVTWR